MTTAPTEYRIRAQSGAGGEGATVHAAGTDIGFDATWGGAPAGLPGPAELLAGALAACLLKNLARAGSMLKFDYADASVEVTARRQDTPPKFVELTYTLHVTTDEPRRRVELVHRNLRNYGTVYNTLAAVCDVHGDLVSAPAADPSTPKEVD